MTFNSFIFVAFFGIVYSAYLMLQRNLRAQNFLLLGASLVFYGYWNWRFLFLLLGTASIDYVVALLIQGTEDSRRRRLYLTVSIACNLGVLGFFKYFNFFASSFADLLSIFGAVHPFMLEIVLPVGISFYTFQAMSYTIDVYRRITPAERSFSDYLTYISFFPQLVAGPIERSSRLLPQVKAPRTIRMEQVDAALFLLLWGYFKKVVIADNCAIIANRIFNDYQSYRGIDLVIGILAFTVQIYGDFSGYSDIARGLAKLMGFDLMLNFRLPYFAQSPADFWRRWHISFSSWLRDYLYIPLGGSRHGKARTYRNLAVTMLLGGLWHGAAWNYLIWGFYHGALLIVYRLLGWEWAGETPSARKEPAGSTEIASARREAEPEGLRARALTLARILLMFVLTAAGWVLFRSRSAGQILYMLTHVGLATSAASAELGFSLLVFSSPLLLVQVLQHRGGDLLAPVKGSLWTRVPAYAALAVGLCIFAVRDSIEFIYFQF